MRTEPDESRRGGSARGPRAPSEEDEGEEDAGAREKLPRRFGRYTLLRRLNAGGMAELYLALHRPVASFEKLVVIKRILPPRSRDESFVAMLLHEARVAAMLSHPGIVHTFDVGEAEGRHFIAMEHIHGEDLRSVVRAMRSKGVAEFPIEHAVGIALGVCAALAYAHEKRDLGGRLLGIVHRDVSPQNVLVTFSGDVKLVDFGVAKSRDLAVDAGGAGGAELIGKVPYMSPEQALGLEVDRRSDIFALGILLFELSTGKRLFKAPTEDETLRLIVGRDYPPPSRVRPGYPPELERIVMRALAKDRRRRYQSAREMQQDLEEFVRGERLATSKVGLARWMERLFEEKLATHMAALHDVKQLADAIASTSGVEAGEAVTESGAGAAAELALPVPEPESRAPARRALGALGGLGLLCLLGATGLAAWGGRAPSLSPASAAEARGGVLEVTSDPPGCAVWLDGDLRPEVTPARIENLPLGREIEVKLTREGLEPERRRVRLDAPGRHARISTAMRPESPSATSGAFCDLEIDGAASPPLPPRGLARISCRAKTGATLSRSVDVAPGGSTRLFFELPE